MARQIKKNSDIHLTRITPSSLKLILQNKTKGLFYCPDSDHYIVVDTRGSKVVQWSCKNIEEIGELPL